MRVADKKRACGKTHAAAAGQRCARAARVRNRGNLGEGVERWGKREAKVRRQGADGRSDRKGECGKGERGGSRIWREADSRERAIHLLLEQAGELRQQLPGGGAGLGVVGQAGPHQHLQGRPRATAGSPEVLPRGHAFRRCGRCCGRMMIDRAAFHGSLASRACAASGTHLEGLGPGVWDWQGALHDRHHVDHLDNAAQGPGWQ